MYGDARLSAAMESMLGGTDAPPAPMSAIRVRMAAPIVPAARRSNHVARYALAAAAAIVLFFAIFPKASLALFERIVVNSYAAAHRLMDWTPPPPPPKALDEAQRSQQLSLAAAQAKVDFTIVPPAGLPPDAVFTGIDTMPALIYDKAKRVWSKSAPALQFDYKRSGGRTFSISAEKDDPRTGPYGKYMWHVDDLPGGKVAMTKHARFIWKNGDQMMSAIEDDGISAAEILAIRAAMHGHDIAHDARETVVKRYRLP